MKRASFITITLLLPSFIIAACYPTGRQGLSTKTPAAISRVPGLAMPWEQKSIVTGTPITSTPLPGPTATTSPTPTPGYNQNLIEHENQKPARATGCLLKGSN
jgi:hypothetical protein